jgi:hypothetical protein
MNMATPTNISYVSSDFTCLGGCLKYFSDGFSTYLPLSVGNRGREQEVIGWTAAKSVFLMDKPLEMTRQVKPRFRAWLNSWRQSGRTTNSPPLKVSNSYAVSRRLFPTPNAISFTTSAFWRRMLVGGL